MKKKLYHILRAAFCLFMATQASPTQWVQANGPYGGGIHCLAISGTDLFAATDGSGVWKRPLSEMVTSVERGTSDVPAQFALEQNFPNPFNPSTTIGYTVPTSSWVKVCVYDLLGREVAVLVSEVKQPGVYTVQWDASGIDSGIYFYRLQTGVFTQTKKMIVLR